MLSLALLTPEVQVFQRRSVTTKTNTMARSAIAMHVSGMASYPYSRPKEQTPNNTTCELCDRTMRTQDWAAHKK